MIACGVLASVDPLIRRLLLTLGRSYVPHLLKPKSHRVVGPHVHAVAEDRVEWLGHVQIADTTAGDARCARADPGLVENHDIGAGPASALLQFHGQMPGGA